MKKSVNVIMTITSSIEGVIFMTKKDKGL